MDAATRRLVRQRASFRCEYCRLPQSAVSAAFHVEHIRPRQHGGGDDPQNLALACDRCNLCKGPNLVGVDLETEHIVQLFDPRRDAWNEHFALAGADVVGARPLVVRPCTYCE
jgi:5-methylcytosine-specific restriction endonuclease McrA